MVAIPVNEIILGIYLGLLAGIFPGFVAFSLGFIFKYFTNVTIPGFGVVALSGGLAGVSGGLMGLLDPALGESWIGIVAVVVILMICLWAHSVGDTLGAETPRKLTIARLRENRLSADLVDRVDSYGQLRVRPVGPVQDIEGYPQLSAELRGKMSARSWRFPAGLPLDELEARVREQLVAEFDLADVEVSIDRQGRARIAAAPAAAGLSRRVPTGRQAITIETLLPTGVARGDGVELQLPDGSVSGTVLSARTTDVPVEPQQDSTATDAGVKSEEGEGDDAETTPAPRAPTTTGGDGRVTIAVLPQEARRLLRHDFATMLVNSRGTQREYEAVAVLRQGGNRLRKLTLGESSILVGQSIAGARVRDTYGVAIFALIRGPERLVAPDPSTTFEPGDHLIVAGKRAALRSFGEVVT